jgi:hypothetical protein
VGIARRIRAGLTQFQRTDAETLEFPESVLSDLQRRGYIPYLAQSRLVAQLGK